MDFHAGCPGYFAAFGAALGAVAGGVGGGFGGGSLGAALCAPTGPVALGCGVEGAAVGAAGGAKIGAAIGAGIGAGLDLLHSFMGKKRDIQQVDDAFRQANREAGRNPTGLERKQFGNYLHAEKRSGDDYNSFEALKELVHNWLAEHLP